MPSPSKPLKPRDLARETRCNFPDLTPVQVEALTSYLNELVAWNQRLNLVGKRDWVSIYRSLVQDSLYLAHALGELPLNDDPLTLDLGAGAGLPGIPLRILWTTGRYLLVEPRQKRALFLHHLLRTLALPETEVRMCRAEQLNEPPADLVLSRALCPWPDFLSLAAPLLSPSGLVLVFSNLPWREGETCPPGWEFRQETSYPVPAGGHRYFWVFGPKN